MLPESIIIQIIHVINHCLDDYYTACLRLQMTTQCHCSQSIKMYEDIGLKLLCTFKFHAPAPGQLRLLLKATTYQRCPYWGSEDLMPCNV